MKNVVVILQNGETVAYDEALVSGTTDRPWIKIAVYESGRLVKEVYVQGCVVEVSPGE